MSSELIGLLDAIRERPDDDLPRLALADWCMEQPDPVLQARGEFIQLRCQSVRLIEQNDPHWQTLAHRSMQLREQHEHQWLGSIVRHVDGWDFERGLVVLELRPNFSARMSLQWLTNRPEWFWVIGVKGVLLGAADTERLVGSVGAERLASLDLSDCEIGVAGARAIATTERLAALANLQMKYTLIGDRGAEELAQAKLERLTCLSLLGANIGPRGIQALASATNLPRLLTLDLSYNTLGPEGAQAISACNGLTALRTLLLNHCQITDRGAMALVRAPALRQLDLLDVRGNGLLDASKRELRDRFGTRVRY